MRSSIGENIVIIETSVTASKILHFFSPQLRSPFIFCASSPSPPSPSSPSSLSSSSSTSFTRTAFSRAWKPSFLHQPLSSHFFSVDLRRQAALRQVHSMVCWRTFSFRAASVPLHCKSHIFFSLSWDSFSSCVLFSKFCSAVFQLPVFEAFSAYRETSAHHADYIVLYDEQCFHTAHIA